MFDYKAIGAFTLRVAVFMLLFSTYPLLTFFMNNMMMRLIFKNREVSRVVTIGLNLSITFVPMLFALFYP